jgi:hypothetical protein
MPELRGQEILDAVTAKALDPSDAGVQFKADLIAYPNDELTKAGLEIPDGVTVKIVENTATTIYLVLPAPDPPDADTWTFNLGEVDITKVCWLNNRWGI